MSSEHPVRTYLKLVGKSQKWLADELGISPTFLSDILNGRRQPRLKLALIIAGKCNVSVSCLLSPGSQEAA